MTQKMTYIAFGFTVGVFLASFFCPAFVVSAVFGISLLLWIIKYKNRRYIILMAIFCILGAVRFACYDQFTVGRAEYISGGNFSMVGTVESVKSYKSYNRVVLNGEIDGYFKTRVILKTQDGVRLYDRISFNGSFSEISDSLLSDSKDYYNSNCIILSAEAEKGNIEILQRDAMPFKAKINKLKNICIEKINQLPNSQAAFLSAMLCGDKSGLSVQTKKALYKCGIGHIMAVSGLHLAIICGIVNFFLGRILKHHKIILFVLSTAFIWFFAAFADFSVSVIRAAFMLTLYNSQIIVKRHTQVINTLAIFCMISSLISPYIVRSGSFLLSVSGVAVFGGIAPDVCRNFENKFARAFATAVLSACVNALICVFLFNSISIISPICNLLLVPLCTAALSLGVVGLIFKPALLASGIIIRFVLFACGKFSKIPFASVSVGYKAVVFTAGALILMAFVVIGFYYTPKLLGTVIVFCGMTIMGLCVFCENYYSGITAVTVISADYSKAAVIYRNRQAIVLDLQNSRYVSGAVNNLLEKKGINNVFYIAGTKPHENIIEYKSSLSMDKIEFIQSDENIKSTDFYDSNIEFSKQIMSAMLADFEISCDDGNIYICGKPANSEYIITYNNGNKKLIQSDNDFLE